MKKLVLLSILTVVLAGCAGTDNTVVADLPLTDIYTKAYDEFNDKNYEESAKKNVLHQLIISQLIKEENIEATEAEVDEKVAEQAKSVEKDVEEYKKNMDPRQFDYIRSDIIITKLFATLKANNEMEVVND